MEFHTLMDSDTWALNFSRRELLGGGAGYFILVRHIARIDSKRIPQSVDYSALTPGIDIRVVSSQ